MMVPVVMFALTLVPFVLFSVAAFMLTMLAMVVPFVVVVPLAAMFVVMPFVRASPTKATVRASLKKSVCLVVCAIIYTGNQLAQ